MSQSTRIHIGQVAALAKVPITSVWQVMIGRGKTIDAQEFTRIKHILDQYDSFILSSSQSQAGVKHIGVVAQTVSKGLAGDYHSVILESLMHTVDFERYMLVHYFYEREDLPNLDEFVRFIDGMVMLGGAETQASEKCRAANRPHVLIDPGQREISDQSALILLDNDAAIRSVVDYLVSLGHRRIAMIAGSLENVVARERLEAFQAAMKAHELPQKREWVSDSHWTEESGHEAALRMLSLSEPPTAIIGANDLIGFGAIRAAREMGLQVGSDVSVTGFDDLPLAETWQLTSVRQPLREMGAMAIDLLIQLMNGIPIPERTVTVSTELVIRQSTGRARHSR